MDDMETCALAHLLTGEKQLGLEAKRRILHFFSWDPEGPTGLWGYDEPAMWVMMRGVRAYDWTYDLFSSEEREKIEAIDMVVLAFDLADRYRTIAMVLADGAIDVTGKGYAGGTVEGEDGYGPGRGIDTGNTGTGGGYGGFGGLRLRRLVFAAGGENQQRKANKCEVFHQRSPCMYEASASMSSGLRRPAISRMMRVLPSVLRASLA